VQFVASHCQVDGLKSLVDRGANTGLAGADTRVLKETNSFVDISGISDHKVPGLRVCSVAGKVMTQKGEVVLIMNQYAYQGEGKTIHSPCQLEHFGQVVDDKPKTLGGRQSIVTRDGYLIPLQFDQGLAYFSMTPPTDQEMDELPHCILTSDAEWNPAVVDSKFDLRDLEWVNDTQNVASDIVHGCEFSDMTGTYCNVDSLTLPSSSQKSHEITTTFFLPDSVKGRNAADVENCVFCVNKVQKYQFDGNKPPDYGNLRLFSVHSVLTPKEATEQNFNVTSLRGDSALGDTLQTYHEHFKLKFSTSILPRKIQAGANNTFFSEFPIFDEGPCCAQTFVGYKPFAMVFYGKEFLDAQDQGECQQEDKDFNKNVSKERSTE